MANSSKLKYKTYNELQNSFETLKSINYTIPEIVAIPNILSKTGKILENRYKILQECGFENIQIIHLRNFLQYFKMKVEELRDRECIPRDLNINERLITYLDEFIDISDIAINDDLMLNDVRKMILSKYLINKLNMPNEEFDNMWKSTYSCKHRSYNSICNTIDVLRNCLNFSSSHIVKHR